MPRIGVETFAADESVAACIKFTGPGDCGAGIEESVMTRFDIIPPEYGDRNGDGRLSYDEALLAPKNLIFDGCGHHSEGDSAQLKLGWLIDDSALNNPNNFWYKEVYYWQENNQNTAVHAIAADVTSGDNFIITNHS